MDNELLMPPSEDELLEVVDSSDPFTVVVRGHQFLGTLLSLAISEALPMPHAVEIERFSFPLKVDLALALRVFPEDCRVGYLKINQLRNRFVHERDAVLNSQDGNEAFAALSSSMRTSFGRESDATIDSLSLIARAIQILFVVLQISITSLRDSKVRDKVLMEMVEKRLRPRPEPYYSHHEKELEERVGTEREQRFDRGDL